MSSVRKLFIAAAVALTALMPDLAEAGGAPSGRSLTPSDLREIRRVVSREELSREQWAKGTPVWQKIRSLPTVMRIRRHNRIAAITAQPDGSVSVRSISGLWGQREFRLEKRNGHWCYVGEIEPSPNIQILSIPPNQRPGVDAGWRVQFAFSRPWPRATQAER
jgi:hypothetical protein